MPYIPILLMCLPRVCASRHDSGLAASVSASGKSLRKCIQCQWLERPGIRLEVSHCLFLLALCSIPPLSQPKSNDIAHISIYSCLSCRYLLYSSCQITSKAYVSEVTEIRPYSLLFFGNNLDVNYASGVVTIDNWMRYIQTCQPTCFICLLLLSILMHNTDKSLQILPLYVGISHLGVSCPWWRRCVGRWTSCWRPRSRIRPSIFPRAQSCALSWSC